VRADFTTSAGTASSQPVELIDTMQP